MPLPVRQGLAIRRPIYLSHWTHILVACFPRFGLDDNDRRAVHPAWQIGLFDDDEITKTRAPGWVVQARLFESVRQLSDRASHSSESLKKGRTRRIRKVLFRKDQIFVVKCLPQRWSFSDGNQG